MEDPQPSDKSKNGKKRMLIVVISVLALLALCCIGGFVLSLVTLRGARDESAKVALKEIRNQVDDYVDESGESPKNLEDAGVEDTTIDGKDINYEKTGPKSYGLSIELPSGEEYSLPSEESSSSQTSAQDQSSSETSSQEAQDYTGTYQQKVFDTTGAESDNIIRTVVIKSDDTLSVVIDSKSTISGSDLTELITHIEGTGTLNPNTLVYEGAGVYESNSYVNGSLYLNFDYIQVTLKVEIKDNIVELTVSTYNPDNGIETENTYELEKID